MRAPVESDTKDALIVSIRAFQRVFFRALDAVSAECHRVRFFRRRAS